MADFLQKYTLVAGTPITIDSSNSASIAYDFTNNSPYDVDIQWGLGKPVSFSIPPTTIWRGASPLTALLISGNQWGGFIIATPELPIGAANGVAATQLTVHGYSKGNVPTEQVINLNTQTSVLMSTATQTIQDGQPPGTTVIESTPAGGPQSMRLDNNGTGILGGGNISIDGSGNVSTLGQFGTTAVDKLITGHQVATAVGYWLRANAGDIPTIAQNFPMQCVNVPSSITLASFASSNASGPAAGNITKLRYSIAWTVGVTGVSQFMADATTVGN